MVNIGIDQSLSNSETYEHRCLENINKLYTFTGKCDDQHNYKAIIEVEMVSTTDRFNNNSTISPGTSVPVRNTIARYQSVYLLKFWTSKRELLSER